MHTTKGSSNRHFTIFSLKTLNVSANRLTFVPPETLYNLSDVRELDLSHNELPGELI